MRHVLLDVEASKGREEAILPVLLGFRSVDIKPHPNPIAYLEAVELGGVAVRKFESWIVRLELLPVVVKTPLDKYQRAFVERSTPLCVE